MEITIKNIENKIYTIRGLQIMLDRDLAALYLVETKVLNQAVKRNIERFPEKFRFQLTEEEYNSLKFQNDSYKTSENKSSLQNVTLENSEKNLRSQIVTSSGNYGGNRYLPYAFTEQGVAMLSAVLRSETAIQVSIQIIDAFVEMRKVSGLHSGLLQRMDRIEIKQAADDQKFEQIFKALEIENTTQKQGVFFDGQTFDAYTFTSDLIRSATQSIQLLDN